MTTSKNQDPLQEIVDVFSQDYNSPVKAIVWAKAIKEWSRFLAVGIPLLLFILFVVFSGDYTPNTGDLPKDHQNVISNLRDIVKFMDITKKSVSERQELYADLMHTVDRYEGRKLNQEDIQNKLDTLVSSLSICNTTRRIHMRRFSHVKNPLLNPEIAASYAKMAKHEKALPERKGSPITAQSEREQWELLLNNYSKKPNFFNVMVQEELS